MASDRALICVKGSVMEDWYIIEFAEHDGQSGIKWDGNLGMFWASSRVSDADVEGTAIEMLAIAEAIEQGYSISFKRCAAQPQADGSVALWSPRNCHGEGGEHVATRDAALALAKSIRAVCTPT